MSVLLLSHVEYGAVECSGENAGFRASWTAVLSNGLDSKVKKDELNVPNLHMHRHNACMESKRRNVMGLDGWVVGWRHAYRGCRVVDESRVDVSMPGFFPGWRRSNI
jgi:hypothetical protein